MKKSFTFAALLVTAVGSWAFYPKTAAESTGHMMVISNVSLGFDAQASITTVAADGSQKEKTIEFSKGSAKRVAANMTEVHKATLAIINEQVRNGWHVVSASPSGFANTGTTFFSQNVYVLEKR